MRTEITSTRLTLDLPVHMHRLVKAHATLNDLSIKDFIIETIEMRFDNKKSAKKNKAKNHKLSKHQMNIKTISVIEDSIKNHDKLKSFKNADDAMKWLLPNKKPKKKKL